MTSKSPQPPATYRAFGLSIHSELPLPDLYHGASTEHPDVTIRIGATTAPVGRRTGFTALAGGALLNIPDVARYWIANGSEIIVEPAPNASERNVRLYLLGSALGAVLHQRGTLPLHANAIEIGGRAVAFAGHSGAGKSTLAAWFHDRGYRVISDDVCAIWTGKVLVVPGGLPRLRLWQDALALTGRRCHNYEPSFDNEQKFDVPTTSGVVHEPLLLGPVYLLEHRPGSPQQAAIEPQRGIEAVDALVANTYRGAFAREMERMPDLLASCVRVAREVPVFQVHRKWGYEAFEGEARRLEQHATDVCGSLNADALSHDA